MMINVLTASTQVSTIELYYRNFALNIGHLLFSDDTCDSIGYAKYKYIFGWIFHQIHVQSMFISHTTKKTDKNETKMKRQFK